MEDDRAVVGMYQERKSHEFLICGNAQKDVWCLELFIVTYFFLFSFFNVRVCWMLDSGIRQPRFGGLVT